jgi:hypothetical protein
MPVYPEFLDSSSGLRIEVEDTESGIPGRAYGTEFLSALRVLAAQTAKQLENLPSEARPTELSISFGLKALASGGFAIALGEADGNFRVSMSWGQSGGGDLMSQLSNLTGMMPER